MSIQELAGKFKGIYRDPEYVLAALIVGVSLTSFWLGRVSGGVEHTPERYGTSVTELRASALVSQTSQEDSFESIEPVDATPAPPQGGYVASRNGTKYHLPHCGSARQITEQNKIFFATKAEAEAAGYTPASNCKGI